MRLDATTSRWGLIAGIACLVTVTPALSLTRCALADSRIGAPATFGSDARATPGADPSTHPNTVADGGALVLLKQMWGGRGSIALGETQVRLTCFPLALEDLGAIAPMGLMVGAHVTPSDHLSIRPKWMSQNRATGQSSRQIENLEGGHRCPVLAPADGYISAIGLRTHPVEGNRNLDITQYRVIMRHADSFWTYIDLIDELEPGIARQVNFSRQGTEPCWIAVKAGERLGILAKNHGLDYGVVDGTRTLVGFVRPESYLAEPWKIHSIDPFDCTPEPLRSQLLEFNPRKVAPLGGKIDLDLPGTLAGSWFAEKNDGLARADGRLQVDWTGHLSFARHYLDTQLIVISVGDVQGRQMQFAVKGNTPDPAQVSEKSGVVKYALMMLIEPSGAAPMANSTGMVVGTALVQVLANGKLRFELFMGNEASAFDAHAQTFKR